MSAHIRTARGFFHFTLSFANNCVRFKLNLYFCKLIQLYSFKVQSQVAINWLVVLLVHLKSSGLRNQSKEKVFSSHAQIYKLYYEYALKC